MSLSVWSQVSVSVFVSTTDPSPMIQINDRQRFVKLTHNISQNQFTQSILVNAEPNKKINGSS